ncbi:protein ECERIFERUM 2 [Mercurialis annua]|uniref:protein ECERIFERUM 2 n=1 Tax=Mercurialis annua TaxID=3986 RepID=UPI00215F171C|nr:protein ECERIFERUM 2 [Mercurialis annua]
MLPPAHSALISDVQLSSVVPGEVTGDSKKDHKLTNMDLALKLHYVKGVYFFTAEAVEDLTIYELKKPMFPWLVRYYAASGRIRRSDQSGRPFIKCNDGGIRIVEACCDITLEEWKLAKNYDDDDDDFGFAYDQVLGPDLGFSPLVYIQFTWFKCGGMCLGLSWAHILGDPFSASSFLNRWAQFLKHSLPSKSLHVSNFTKSECPLPMRWKPFCLNRVDPVGNHWVTTNNCKMVTHSFHFPAKLLDNLVSESDSPALIHPVKSLHFEFISAIFWKSLSKIRGDSGPRIVTVCTRIGPKSENEAPSNTMTFSIVRADFSAAKGGIEELAMLIAEKQEGENKLIEESIDEESDYIAYGANLTFINMEEANIYGVELNGHKPIFANYTIKGVGDEGAVLVLPAGPDNGGDTDKRSGGRRVTVILPEKQLQELKNELKKEWGIASGKLLTA